MNAIYLGNPPSSYIKWITAYYKGYYTIIHYNDGTPSKEVKVGDDGILTWEIIGKTSSTQSNINIESVEIGREVTTIGDYVFNNCTSLTFVTIPEGVTTISDQAFEDCSSLTSVTIPDSVTMIGYSAFEDCGSLSSVIIPDSMTDIGSNAFSGCSGLTSVTIPSNVKWIGGSAFYGVAPTELTAAQWPSGMSSENIKILTIPEGVTNIVNYAFRGCNGLMHIVFPSSITSIGWEAFKNCDCLKTITIPNSVTQIGAGAFEDCNSLSSVTIPYNVTFIGDSVFGQCYYLTSITFEGTPNITVGTDAFTTGNENTIGYYLSKYAAEWQDVIVDGKWNGLTMEHIVPEYTIIHYNDGTPSKEVAVENDGILTYQLIGKTSYDETNTNIESIEIGRDVTSIGAFAFDGCESLIYMTIPESVTTISNEAFQNCSSLTSVTILDGVTEIGDSTFEACSSLTSMAIPESVSAIGSEAFKGCANITEMSLPLHEEFFELGFYEACFTGKQAIDTTSSIKEFALSVCDSASMLYANTTGEYMTYAYGTNMYFEGGVTYYFYAEYDDKTFVKVEDTVVISPHSTDCVAQTSNITFENAGWRWIELRGYNHASAGATNNGKHKGFLWWTSEDATQRRFTKDENDNIFCTRVLTLSDIFGGEHINIQNVEFICSASHIPTAFFAGCLGLMSATIPDGVSTIGNNAFNCCSSLTSAIIPEGVTLISRKAFYDCSSLTSITFEGTPNITVGTDAFTTGNENTIGYYLSKYAAEWQDVIVDGKWNGLTMEQGAPIHTIIHYNDGTPSKEVPVGDDGVLTWKIIGKTGLRQTNTTIKSVELGRDVTSIGSYAFCNCRNLTSVTIPPSVIEIGYDAFELCNNLTSVNISDIATWCKITFVDDDANPLYYAKNIYLNGSIVTDLEIPKGVTSISGRAFRGCTGLISVTIPEGVTTISDQAFEDCSSLTSVTIPSSVTEIGEGAFYNCSNLTSVTIPEGVKLISYAAFSNCASLTVINIPCSVTSIYGNAFYNCYNLTSVTIPEGVTSIESQAFYHCSGLTSVTIPSSVTSIGGLAFSGCSRLTSVTIPEGVKSIQFDAFSDCDGLTSVTIPSSVTEIGSWAFANCNCLTEVEFNCSNITAITSTAIFYNCENLITFTCQNLTVDKLVKLNKNLGLGITYNGKHLVICYCKDGVVVINGKDASSGENNKYVVKLTLANGTTKTINLKKSTLKASNIEQYKSNIVTAEIGDGITEIGFGAFSNCLNLTDIIIPSSVTSIGDVAFENCSKLIYMTIPNSVTEIGMSAFRYCNSLTSIEIPSSVTSIGERAFMGCTSLTSVIIPEGVPEIIYYTFASCISLTSVTIPSSVSQIGQNAFYNCNSLTEIDLSKHNTPPRLEATNAIPSNVTTIYIKQGTLSLWQSTTNWTTMSNKFKEKIIVNTDENTPVILSMLDATTGETAKLSPDCSFVITGTNLNLDQSDEDSGFYIVTSGGQNLKCTVISNETNNETVENTFLLINPVSFTDSASYIMYKQLADNNEYYIIRYPQNDETFVIE